ncbi:MAG: transposase [Chitinophagales bacterium]
MDSELLQLRELFSSVSDFRSNNLSYALPDILMSGFVLFSLKSSSLLNFEQQNKTSRKNLFNIYGIKKLPSDTQLRAVLDRIDPTFLRDHFATKFTDLRKTGILKDYSYKIGSQKYLPISRDGVQHFSSKTINCSCCLSKNHKDGSTTFQHKFLCAALVHPHKREVFILDAEPIEQQDGITKNDCELNAAKRLNANWKKQYGKHQSQYKFLILEDALYANGVHIKELESQGLNYIINVKPKSHKTLFKCIEGKDKRKHLKTYSFTQDGIKHEFKYVNDVLLNNSHPNLRVNFVHYVETDKKGNKKVFSWITNIKISNAKLVAIMRAGRARWKVENEVFNTLKNLGYHFEHNFGHGKDHLSTMFAYLMLMAFYIDQFVQVCSKVFIQLEKGIRTKIKLWESIRGLFAFQTFSSMSALYYKAAEEFEIKIRAS